MADEHSMDQPANSESPRRRRFPRIPSENAVLVKRLGELPAEEFAVTRSVGLGGCAFTSRESFGIDAHLKLLITIQRDVVEARARVVYETPREDDRYTVGVEFLEVENTDRLKIALLFSGEEVEAGG